MVSKQLTSIFAICTALLMLAACGADTEKMQAGLTRGGMDAAQAKCLAEAAADNGVASGPYDYIASLTGEGVAVRDAVNKARRKFGSDFRGPWDDAVKACGK